MKLEAFLAYCQRGQAAQAAVDEACETAASLVEKSRPRALNPTQFINRAAVRDFLLEYARANRAHKFERVSSETLQAINEAVRQQMIAHVRRLPSKGKTI